eukprot:scaffold39702_cov144-Skeletonema_dohrnii-CCMP3373.AAC.5
MSSQSARERDSMDKFVQDHRTQSDYNPTTLVFGALPVPAVIVGRASVGSKIASARSKHCGTMWRSLHYPLTQNDECYFRRATSSSVDISPDLF